MAVVSSCREVLGSVPQRAQPSPFVANGKAGHSKGTASDKLEEGEDDVKSSWPLYLGQHTCNNGRYRRKQDRKVEQTRESRSQFGLRSATRPHEVGIASNRVSARRGEYVPGPCTHRPSHHESLLYPKSVPQPETEGAAQGMADDWGEVVTR